MHLRELQVAVMLIALTTVPCAASADHDPRWFDVEGGVGFLGGDVAFAGSLCGMAGVSQRIDSGTRLALEIGYIRTSPPQGIITFPEVDATYSGSNIGLALAGVELYGPIRGHSAPFLQGELGVALYAEGPQHVSRFVGPGNDWIESTYQHRAAWLPAWSLALGFRRLPREGGWSPRASMRDVILWDQRVQMHVVSALVGIGF